MDGPLWVAGHGEDWSKNTEPWCGQWGPRKCLQGSHQNMGLGHVLGGDVQGKQAPLLALLHQPQPSVLVSVVLKPWQPTPAWNIAYAGLKQDSAGKAQQREIEWNTKLETHIIKPPCQVKKKNNLLFYIVDLLFSFTFPVPIAIPLGHSQWKISWLCQTSQGHLTKQTHKENKAVGAVWQHSLALTWCVAEKNPRPFHFSMIESCNDLGW